MVTYCLFQALELNPSDQNALVARSKCHLLLGDPTRGLQVVEILATWYQFGRI